MASARPFVLFLSVLAARATMAGESPTTDSASESGSRVSVHGSLSQAFADADDVDVFGVPTSGTFDFRTAALQLRAEVSERDSFVVQLAHERLGTSPAVAAHSEIELDWIFYEHAFGHGLNARVGKVKIPFGIYNETHFIGALLPLFRAPDAFYGVGSYNFDSVSGGVASLKILAGHPFSVDLDGYAGEWRVLQSDDATYARAMGVGGQIWITTPLRGVRVGLGGNRSRWESSLTSPSRDVRETHSKWVASFDGNLPRVHLSAEYEKDVFGGVFDAGYALATLHVTDKLSVIGQVSRSHVKVPAMHIDLDMLRDDAVGLSYAARPDLVVKVENHWAKGYALADLGNFSVAFQKARYVIVSVSAVF